MQLSKSDYLTYLRHPAWLWLKRHQKATLPPTDPALQALFDAGNKFERYAEQLFSNGVTLGFENYSEYQSLPSRTTSALSEGAETIFQGRFEFDQLTCIVDVLQRVDGQTFDLFEIKASTSAKSEHIPDLAFQRIVLEGAGLILRNVGVVHVDNKYRRQGEIDIEGITSITDVTEKVAERMPQTKEEIEKALVIISSDTLPDPSPRYASDLAEWMEIYSILRGPFDKHSIYNLAGIKPEQIAYLEDSGISQINNIPDDMELQRQQPQQVAVTKSGQRHVDLDAIREFLEGLEYPLYFLDYETFSDVIPTFDGLRPYQATPFQYSLHVFDHEGAELRHREYLHTENSNPVAPLLAQLRENIGVQGSVIVWYAPFEKGRNKDMAAMSTEHAAFLENINDRIVDLMVPFKSGWFVDKDFLGSASIKKVLPVLVPELSYEGLDIASGDVAQLEWMDAVVRNNNPNIRETVMVNLRRYCELDTLAMVRIFEVLNEVVKSSGSQSDERSPNFLLKMYRTIAGISGTR